ncbi:MAG TPA: ABC transporter permease [Gemmata sp.]
MSSIPPATTDPTAPARSAAPPPDQTGPSDLLIEGPAIARMVGFVGLFLLVLGTVVVVATKATGTARLVSEGWGFLFAGTGLVLMLYHAVSDGEQEVRRMYGMLAGAFLVLALAAALLPGAAKGETEKVMGFYLLPWGVASGLLALLFAVPFLRHETDARLRSIGSYTLLGVGALLCVGVLVKGVWAPDWLAGTGLALAVLGLSFLAAYLGQVNTDEGIGYVVASTIGAVGAAAVLYAFGRTVFPTVLYDGPSVLRDARQELDVWAATGRALVVLAFLGLVALGALGKFPVWLRASLAVVGLVSAGVFVLASTKSAVTTPPQPFLVPGGLIIGGIGLAYLALAIGVCSDGQFVTLLRRELAAYFLSPIGYLVLGGMAVAQWFGYYEFVRMLDRAAVASRPLSEPIVSDYVIALFPIFGLKLQVAALTMRLFAEEKRSGTLEVLFTAPVSEWVAVASKFAATWFFFMVCWLPAGLFLIVLRMEGGTPFDYRPLLGFYVALGATGAAFLAIGMFLSALTSNQIVAAVLTFMVMLMLLLASFFSFGSVGMSQTLQLVLSKLGYLGLWRTALSGQLPIRDVIQWASLAVFFVFLTIKTIEVRRWS